MSAAVSRVLVPADPIIPAHDPVATDSQPGLVRRQTRPGRWDGASWDAFVADLQSHGVAVRVGRVAVAPFLTDGGGVVRGCPHGVVHARATADVATVLAAAQTHGVPVTVRGGGKTTEGESVAPGGLALDLSALCNVIAIDRDQLTVRCQAGIFWHSLAERLRRDGLDYCSAPLNLTSSVGGTLGVGGIDVNSPRLGCSADQAIALEVVTPTGRIVRCSASENAELFERVLLGYGQFGVITEATLPVRPYRPIRLEYLYYSSLRAAITDMQRLVEADAADHVAILTIMDAAITLLVAFESDERAQAFAVRWRHRLSGMSEQVFAVRAAVTYGLRPWAWREARYLLRRRLGLFPDLRRPEHQRGAWIHDRTVVFSRAVWKHWGGREVVIPDLSANSAKFIEAVERGNAVCRKFFPYYTLYCVGIRLFGRRPRYEMSCIPADAENFAYGCEFEPMLADLGHPASHDRIQDFKNAIYDIAPAMGLSCYRFGGAMKGYVRRIFPAEVVDRHLAWKRAADPAFILNPGVVF
jgi:FAD/FMN-containing dehydrogenase